MCLLHINQDVFADRMPERVLRDFVGRLNAEVDGVGIVEGAEHDQAVGLAFLQV